MQLSIVSSGPAAASKCLSMEAYTDWLSRGVKRFTLVKKKLTRRRVVGERRRIPKIAIMAFYILLVAWNG